MNARLRTPAMEVEKWSILAGLRFMLASMVAIGHLHMHAPSGWTAWLTRFDAFDAILGFLVISGYSIGHSYQVKSDGFLVRRVKRLYPVYIASLVVTVLVNQLSSEPPGIPWLQLLLNALLLNQLLTTESYLGPAWSLALEFWLYCLTPLLITLNPRRIRVIIFASLACYLCYVIARPILKLPYFSSVGGGLNLPLLAFTWIAGFRLSRSDVNPREALRDIGLIFGAHWLCIVMVHALFRIKNHKLDEFVQGDLPTLLARATTLLFVWLVFRQFVAGRGEEGRKSLPLRFLGDVSYPLYLLHVPVIMFLAGHGWHSAALLFGASLVVSAIAYQLLDSYSRKRHLVR